MFLPFLTREVSSGPKVPAESPNSGEKFEYAEESYHARTVNVLRAGEDGTCGRIPLRVTGPVGGVHKDVVGSPRPQKPPYAPIVIVSTSLWALFLGDGQLCCKAPSRDPGEFKCPLRDWGPRVLRKPLSQRFLC